MATAADKRAKKAELIWSGYNEIHGGPEERPLENRTGMFGEVPTAKEMQLEYGTDVKPFEVGDELGAEKEYWLNPMQAASVGLQAGSAMTNATSAYGQMDPSAYERLGPSSYDSMAPSAYGNLRPSAYGSLSFDPNRMGESQDYFASVMSDPVDDIAEADYARRQGQAEQMRRSHSEAALRDAEMRGQGAAGDRILAELSGNQAMAGDMYQAGMDANATSQMRRDSAAGSLADVSDRIGRGELEANAARASGLDTYGLNRSAGLDAYGANQAAGRDSYDLNRAGGLDAYGANQASGLDTFATARAGAIDDWGGRQQDYFYDAQNRNVDRMTEANQQNWMRQNMVGDQNTSAQNDTTYHNKILAPQQEFTGLRDVAAGASGQYQASSNLLADEKARRDARTDQYVDRAINAASSLAKSQGK